MEAQPIDLIVNGTFITPQGPYHGDLLIKDGRIAALARSGELPSGSRYTVVDAEGNYVLPGLVDPECHLGATRAFPEDVSSETRAALATGVTTWGMQQQRVNTTEEFIEAPTPQDHGPWSEVVPFFAASVNELSYVDAYLTPCLMTDEQAEEIPLLADEFGLTSFKMYLHLRAGPEKTASKWHIGARTLGFNDGTVFRAMRNIHKLGYPGLLSVHCENWEIAWVLEEDLRRAGRTDTKAWDEKSPPFVEAGHVRTYAYYARVARCPLHIQHVTTADTVEEIERARADGAVVYGQTGPHYLVLDHTAWKINVPLRSAETASWLWGALRRGRIDAVGSDHIFTAKTRDEMDRGNVWDTVSGFPSRVEVLLPALLDGVSHGRLTLEQVVQVTSENTARIWGLYPQKGCIGIGSDADLVIVDLDRTVTIERATVQSQAPWSIYEGRTFTGWPIRTLLRGKLVVDWPKDEMSPRIASVPSGQYLTRRCEPLIPYRASWRALKR